MSVFEYLMVLLVLTLFVAHTGIAFAGVLQMPGNLLDWLPGKIQRIQNPYFRDLFSCMKCVSGQVALWTFLAISVMERLFHPVYSPGLCIMWVCFVIVVTDQLAKWEGYG